MSAPQESKKSDTVYGWKGISAVLGCVPNTARRYAAEYGLPVRRRGGRYEAKEAELLAWLEEWKKSPVDGRLRPQVLPPKPAVWNRKLFLVGVACLAAAALAVVPPKLFDNASRHQEGIARALVRNKTLSALSDAGRKLWTIPLPEILDEPVVEGTHYLIRDVNGDSRQELVFIERKRQHREKTSRLLCLNEHGEQLWQFNYGRELRVGKRVFSPTFEGVRVAWIETERRSYLLTIGYQKPWYPSQVVLLEPSTGTVLGEYLHPGQLTDFLLVDLDSDPDEEILLGGINNPGAGYGRPVLVALDFPFPKAAVAESFFGPMSGRELSYLVLPELDVYRARDMGAAVRRISRRPGGRILVAVGVESDKLLFYEFNTELQVGAVHPADGFVREHESLYRLGRLDHTFDRRRELAQWSKVLRFATAPDANRLGEEEKPS